MTIEREREKNGKMVSEFQASLHSWAFITPNCLIKVNNVFHCWQRQNKCPYIWTNIPIHAIGLFIIIVFYVWYPWFIWDIIGTHPSPAGTTLTQKKKKLTKSSHTTFCHYSVNRFKNHLYGIIVLVKWWFKCLSFSHRYKLSSIL